MTQPEQEKQDLNVAIFWRQEAKKLKYEWFGQVWTSDEDNKTQEELKATLKRLLSPNEILSHDTILKVHKKFRYHSRFFDCLAHPNLSATLATDQK